MANYRPPPSAYPPLPPAAHHHASHRSSWWQSPWIFGAAAVLGVLAVIGSVASGGAAKTVTKTVAGPTTTATVSTTVTATPTVIKTIATRTQTVRVTYTPPVKVAFTDGTFRVGGEIAPGTYHTDDADGSSCYYEREAQGTGIDSIIANDNFDGPTTIDVASSDYALKTSGGCDWVRR